MNRPVEWQYLCGWSGGNRACSRLRSLLPVNKCCSYPNQRETSAVSQLLEIDYAWSLPAPCWVLCTVEILTHPEFKSDNQGLCTVTESTVWSLCLKASFSLVITSRIAYKCSVTAYDKINIYITTIQDTKTCCWVFDLLLVSKLWMGGYLLNQLGQH